MRIPCRVAVRGDRRAGRPGSLVLVASRDLSSQTGRRRRPPDQSTSLQEKPSGVFVRQATRTAAKLWGTRRVTVRLPGTAVIVLASALHVIACLVAVLQRSEIAL